jgi:[1-hydroxy-2-(trimethylamino)ethyl]phosphonate dioxygenase
VDIVGVIERLFDERGRESYFGEPVSQTEHALQAAHLAEAEGAPDSLVVAALLHDVGHLVHGLPEDLADRELDGHHEDVGVAWLAGRFDAGITEPIRLHVAAKRYLCAVDPSYRDGLSPASLRSLTLQGGPFDGDEVARFEANPHCRDAVRLRRWDDAAKVQGLAVPGLSHYHARLQYLARKLAAS